MIFNDDRHFWSPPKSKYARFSALVLKGKVDLTPSNAQPSAVETFDYRREKKHLSNHMHRSVSLLFCEVRDFYLGTVEIRRDGDTLAGIYPERLWIPSRKVGWCIGLGHCWILTDCRMETITLNTANSPYHDGVPKFQTDVPPSCTAPRHLSRSQISCNIANPPLPP